jgi:hypothetical protein
LLGEEWFADLLEKASRQPAEQRSQAGLDRDNLLGGQTFDDLLRQQVLRSAQDLGFSVLKACKGRADGLSPAVLERIRE